MPNSGGVVGVAYYAARFIGENVFVQNEGTSITVSWGGGGSGRCNKVVIAQPGAGFKGHCDGWKPIAIY